MRYCVILIVALIFLSACERKVPAYEGEDGDVNIWFDVYGDTTKDMGAYLNYESGKLIPTISWYAQRDSMDYLQDLTLWLEGFEHDTLIFVQGEFPGTSKSTFEGISFSVVRDAFLLNADSLTSEQLSIQAQTSYPVAEVDLPESIYLHYSVTTNLGTKAGKVLFRKTEKTIVETMRFH